MPVIKIDSASPHLEGVDLSRPVWLASPHGRLQVSVELSEGLAPDIVLGRRGGGAKPDTVSTASSQQPGPTSATAPPTISNTCGWKTREFTEKAYFSPGDARGKTPSLSEASAALDEEGS